MASWIGVVAFVHGCADPDPIRHEEREDLGAETPGIPEGPLHRAGQPCLVCHDGTNATPLSVAGTIYELTDADRPAAGARVHLMDASGNAHVAAANCAGNFFVRPGDFLPDYPMWVKVELAGWVQEMDSPVNGDGSCAACHASLPGPRSAGRVYVFPFEVDLEEAGCP